MKKGGYVLLLYTFTISAADGSDIDFVRENVAYILGRSGYGRLEKEHSATSSSSENEDDMSDEEVFIMPFNPEQEFKYALRESEVCYIEAIQALVQALDNYAQSGPLGCKELLCDQRDRLVNNVVKPYELRKSFHPLRTSLRMPMMMADTILVTTNTWQMLHSLTCYMMQWQLAEKIEYMQHLHDIAQKAKRTGAYFYGFAARDDNLNTIENCFPGRFVNEISTIRNAMHIYTYYYKKAGHAFDLTNDVYSLKKYMDYMTDDINEVKELVAKEQAGAYRNAQHKRSLEMRKEAILTTYNTYVSFFKEPSNMIYAQCLGINPERLYGVQDALALSLTKKALKK